MIKRGALSAVYLGLFSLFSSCAGNLDAGIAGGGPVDIPASDSSVRASLGWATAPQLGAPRAKLPPPPLELTAETRRELSAILRNHDGYLTSALRRREGLLPLIAEIWEDEGMPPELINVALIESRFDPNARSHAGAVGMWQFMRSTARIYGLRVTAKEDQRRDPILSTIAAARHLRDLYHSYNDWLLALAAYNAGSGAIDRALRRTRASDFWALARNRRRSGLRIETARYVPRFIAVSFAIKNHETFGAERALVMNRAAAGLG